MDGWPLSERAERRDAPRPPSTHADPSTGPLYTLYEDIIALHRAVMWVHWGLLQQTQQQIKICPVTK